MCHYRSFTKLSSTADRPAPGRFQAVRPVNLSQTLRAQSPLAFASSLPSYILTLPPCSSQEHALTLTSDDADDRYSAFPRSFSCETPSSLTRTPSLVEGRRQHSHPLHLDPPSTLTTSTIPDRYQVQEETSSVGRLDGSIENTAITYSPLFIRSFSKQHKLRITSKGIKKRFTERFEANHKTPAPRKPLATMAQVLSPGALPEPMVQPKQEPWLENLNVKMICKDCKEDPPELYEDHSSGDLMCANCGLVLAERTVDMSSEWRTFSNDDQGNDDPSRVGDGPNSLLNGAQLNTSIAFGDGMKSRELHRAQNKANLDKGNKNLLMAYKQIGALCDGWHLTGTVSDTAKHLFKDADESRLFKGKSQEALIAGCVFLACRRNQVPRSFREVMELTKVSKKEIGRTFKTLEQFLMNRDKESNKQKITVAGGQVAAQPEYQGTSTAAPQELCARYCDALNMTHQVSYVATALATRMTELGILAGRSPLSSAAACIYMAGHLMGQVKSAKDIQAVARVSDSTIRHAYKLLYQDKDKLITEEVLARGADKERLPKPS
ncbi:transcription initiation factor IIB [Teratosphaeriaceae sp. CCFEE 6253]|nr:transcription initiation factor IIB [Teratosphaeriaceae sp. CCFEE 6253]